MQKQVAQASSEKSVTTSWKIQAGPNSGGLVQDANIDGATGATSWRFQVGLHPQINIRKSTIETGLDIIGYNQSLNYARVSGYDGTRTFN